MREKCKIFSERFARTFLDMDEVAHISAGLLKRPDWREVNRLIENSLYHLERDLGSYLSDETQRKFIEKAPFIRGRLAAEDLTAIKEYAEQVQETLLSEGLLALIECECGGTSPESMGYHGGGRTNKVKE